MIGYCWSFNMSLEVEIKQTTMKVACCYLIGQRFKINHSRLMAVHLNLWILGCFINITQYRVLSKDNVKCPCTRAVIVRLRADVILTV